MDVEDNHLILEGKTFPYSDRDLTLSYLVKRSHPRAECAVLLSAASFW